MVAAPVRAGPRPAVGGGRPYPQAVVREPVLDAEGQRERVARPGMQHVLHHDPVLRAVGRRSTTPSGRGRGSRPAPSTSSSGSWWSWPSKL